MNFTLTQIKEAHSKVKSGADFPQYICEIKAFGVIAFETYVKNGQSKYFGHNNYSIISEQLFDELPIADSPLKDLFCSKLKTHQQGKTDYFTFCSDCAKTGIEKWVIDLNIMTCTYYDKGGNIILIEKIPA